MKVVPVEQKSYGKFHTGDSYIILNVRSLIAILSLFCIILETAKLMASVKYKVASCTP